MSEDLDKFLEEARFLKREKEGTLTPEDYENRFVILGTYPPDEFFGFIIVPITKPDEIWEIETEADSAAHQAELDAFADKFGIEPQLVVHIEEPVAPEDDDPEDDPSPEPEGASSHVVRVIRKARRALRR